MSYDKYYDFTSNWAGLQVNNNDVCWLIGGKVPTSLLPDTIVGSVDYKGTWDASANTPDLPVSTPDKGDYYVVSVAGTTSLGGITDWNIGDWAIYNGTSWEKVDNTQELDDTPVDGELAKGITSNWAFDHAALVSNTSIPCHVPTVPASPTSKWLRGDNTWQTIPSSDIKLAVDGRETGKREVKDSDGDLLGYLVGMNQNDYWVFRCHIPSGFDTSKKSRIYIDASWNSGNQAVAVNMDFSYRITGDGEDYTIAATTGNISIPAANQDVKLTGFYYEFSASAFNVGDQLKFKINTPSGYTGEELLIRESCLQVEDT